MTIIKLQYSMNILICLCHKSMAHLTITNLSILIQITTHLLVVGWVSWWIGWSCVCSEKLQWLNVNAQTPPPAFLYSQSANQTYQFKVCLAFYGKSDQAKHVTRLYWFISNYITMQPSGCNTYIYNVIRRLMAGLCLVQGLEPNHRFKSIYGSVAELRTRWRSMQTLRLGQLIRC